MAARLPEVCVETFLSLRQVLQILHQWILHQ